ncbi:MAG: cupin domain-containing protein [Oceanicoccus sp.]|uniref:cupin domain-containing protein n=1 Tax=Oceanicoccus sp. TaxID=2691044 RepID=UPI002608979D|nr:cupin domain-containing protein [Oceanicoccus sp.]MCP3906467.1 cupin domain-containing protein [Oceanicoccus sp.]
MKNFFEETANNNDQWFSETIGEDAADETFIVLSGTVLIDTPESTITISQGQSYSVKPGIEHRARVKGARRWGAMGQTLSLFFHVYPTKFPILAIHTMSLYSDTSP